MVERIEVSGLQVARELHAFIENEALPGSGVDGAAFWAGLSSLTTQFSDRNRTLLEARETIQKQIDEWHLSNKNAPHDYSAYKAFLMSIGYLKPEGPAFQIETTNIDPEIAEVAGPQLVVPITNARYALNAANARWGSLYDGLYGTDAMGSLPPAGAYDRGRGTREIDRARIFKEEK